MKRLLFALLVLALPELGRAQTCTQADNNHPDSVALTWTDNSQDENGFILERKQDSAAYVALAVALTANITAFTDSTIKRGSVPTTYTYRVKAFRNEADKTVTQSSYSNEACITFAASLPPPPKPLPEPVGLTISAISSSSFRITWEADPVFPGYALDGKLARGNDAFSQIAYLPQGAATYDWTGRKKFTSYCVRIRGDKADADYTPTLCATTAK